jgi:polyisoprenoid-binding protein YceI
MNKILLVIGIGILGPVLSFSSAARAGPAGDGAAAIVALIAGKDPASEAYVIDRPGSKVEFCVAHFPFSQVRGEFADFAGGFAIEPDAIEKSQAVVSIHTGSIDTQNKEIDALVTGEQFFNVEQFPEITFKGKALEPTGQKTARLEGDLTLRGVTKPVSFEVNLEEGLPDSKSNGQDTLAISATTEISRSEFGMTGLLPVVSDKVRICLAVKARLVAADSPVPTP